MTPPETPPDPRAAGAAAPRKPVNVRLPGFVSDTDIGLGDAIRRVTSQMAIHSCGGCERRAAALNRWMVFSGRRPG